MAGDAAVQRNDRAGQGIVGAEGRLQQHSPEDAGILGGL
jgi:hypothetical protein